MISLQYAVIQLMALDAEAFKKKKICNKYS